MIVCHCGVVSDREVSAALDDGARTLTAVCRATGAAQGCGACIFSVKRLICQHQPADAPTVMEAPTLMEVVGAAG